MATTFEEQADQFVKSGRADQNYNEEIYAPVKLSNSTKRHASAIDALRSGMAESSLHARVTQDEQARRMEIDRMEDEAYNRRIEQRAKAAAWNDKVKAQEHGSLVMESLVDLDPTDPEFLTKKDGLLGKFPMAILDDRVRGVVDTKSKIFDIARQERDRAEEIARRQIERQENIQDNRNFQQETARINRDETLRTNIELKVAEMSAEGQGTYKRLLEEGKPALEAYQSARLDDKGVITPREANAASRTIQNYDRQIAQAQKALNEVEANLVMGDSEKALRRSEYQTMIEELGERRQLELDVVESYWEAKGGRPKPATANNPGPTVPQGDSPRSGASPTPDSLTPTIDPKKIRAATEWIRANPDDPRAKKLQEQLKGMTRGSL